MFGVSTATGGRFGFGGLGMGTDSSDHPAPSGQTLQTDVARAGDGDTRSIMASSL